MSSAEEPLVIDTLRWERNPSPTTSRLETCSETPNEAQKLYRAFEATGTFCIEKKSGVNVIPDNQTTILTNAELATPELAQNIGRTTTATRVASMEPSQSTGSRGEALDALQHGTIVLILGKDRFEQPCELGSPTERPLALNTITPLQPLGTSAFIKPALLTVLAELGPFLKSQTAVRLVSRSLRITAKILLPHSAKSSNDHAEDAAFAEILSLLEDAIPKYDWQGPRNKCGRVRYVMALLEEVIRVFAIPQHSLIEALTLDQTAICALQEVSEATRELGLSYDEMCGPWAAANLFSALENGLLQDRPADPHTHALHCRSNASGERNSLAGQASLGDQEGSPLYIPDSQDDSSA